MKIIDTIRDAQASGRIFFSLEFFPPKTGAGVENLYDRISRMAEQCSPDWIDITYGPATADLSVELASTVQNLTGIHTMMHMTGTNQPKSQLLSVLKRLREAGVMNLLALRGDPPMPEVTSTFASGDSTDIVVAKDFVRFIRSHFGDEFGIAVAGYPEKRNAEEIQYLKEKVDAGADFIVTQFFYDVSAFTAFVSDCRSAGIVCPIVPGCMPIQTYSSFKRMTQFVGNHVPQEVLDQLEPVKDDDDAVKAYGVEHGIQMAKQLLKLGVRGMHFYTLNLERTVLGILEGLELTPSSQCSPGTLAARQFPWQRQRSGESVRPVFWSNRPHSYCARTSTWDDFPNGRWTNSRSPAFGELRDYHLVSVHASPLNRSECRRAWGENPTTEADVAAIFIKFLEGEISALPWMTGPLAPESRAILAPLVALNEKGFLTINSQPRVNGAPSSDPAFGWGGPHGRVFQKAYLEFFVAPEKMEMLQVAFAAHARLSWQAVNADGDFRTNARGVNALTWGVFPGKEILQPTVVDAEAFLAWKDEAFGLWQTRWRVLYDESSESYALIERIASTYYLVNLVDNDYMVEDDLMSRVLLSL